MILFSAILLAPNMFHVCVFFVSNLLMTCISLFSLTENRALSNASQHRLILEVFAMISVVVLLYYILLTRELNRFFERLELENEVQQIVKLFKNSKESILIFQT